LVQSAAELAGLVAQERLHHGLPEFEEPDRPETQPLLEDAEDAEDAEDNGHPHVLTEKNQGESPVEDKNADPAPWGDPIPSCGHPFPRCIFPSTIENYVESLADTMSAPFDFVGGAVLATAGGAMGVGWKIELKESLNWIERGNSYVALVGPPSYKKSPVV